MWRAEIDALELAKYRSLIPTFIGIENIAQIYFGKTDKSNDFEAAKKLLEIGIEKFEGTKKERLQKLFDEIRTTRNHKIFMTCLLIYAIFEDDAKRLEDSEYFKENSVLQDIITTAKGLKQQAEAEAEAAPLSTTILYFQHLKNVDGGGALVAGRLSIDEYEEIVKHINETKKIIKNYYDSLESIFDEKIV